MENQAKYNNEINNEEIQYRDACVERMIEKFGMEKAQAFCELFAFYYRYMYTDENKEDDIKNAKWYEDKLRELKKNDEIHLIANYYGLPRQIIQLAEEAAELIQAIARRNKGKNSNIGEEIADVRIMLRQIVYLFDCEEDIVKREHEKIERQLYRISQEKSARAFLNRF